ncbi:MAG: thioredoxin domain-containing protein [Deltaproteobacteria bacterium]|jgi:protein-disulfide isomerase|nr:thioredoxin domain-containing protein [Deltaproteobacteria bacterium]
MPLFEQVLDRYPESVKVVFKHYPLDFHKQAFPAALASMAAAEQGRFWEYHDELFLQQGKLHEDKYPEIARNLGLDLKKFSLDMMRPSVRKKIEQDIAEAKKAGITGTPTIFVNGRKLKKRGFGAISKMIEAELAKQR